LAAPLVAWQVRHGRNDLPWQNTRDPYRVWLSEIMLQQTQVSTVRDYFARFLQRFPNVAALAAAPLDEVLGLWSGLGYYARARHMHQCAKQVMALHAGQFPRTALQLQTLPGIGPSTAAAIAALCFGQRVAILDGNVKRVLTRVLGFAADLSQSAHVKQLWALATACLPETDLAQTMPRYTQGVMDLGALVCLAKNPRCGVCPLAALCVARAQGEPERYPVKTRRLKRSAQSLWLLWAQAQDGSVWLQQRPASGVWAGLFCLPWFDSAQDLALAVPKAWRADLQPQPAFKHVLTHKDLHLHPVRLCLPQAALSGPTAVWQTPQEWPRLGLPAPIRALLSGP
jgi:A/G-specific adenine glycosylase